MKELIKFFVKYSFFIFFLFLEGVSFLLIFQNNSFQKSAFINFTRNVTGYFYENLQGYKEYFKLREINYQISEENIRLRNEIYNLRLSTQLPSSSHQEQLSDSIQELNYEYILARVVNNSVHKQYNFITLGAGKLDGMTPDMAVVSEQGVTGIITNVSDHFSLVLPVINRNFRLSAKIKRNNYFGILEWEGIKPDQASLKEIPVHADIFLNDEIVTSGFSAIFPEGITVGRVIEYRKGDGNFYEIIVKLATDFNNLFFVNVIKNHKQEEQISLENNSGL